MARKPGCRFSRTRQPKRHRRHHPTWLLLSRCQWQLRLDQVGRSTILHAASQEIWSRSFSALLQFSPSTVYQNGKACANKGVSGSNLADNHYADFAKFLTTTTKHFTDKGYNITLVDRGKRAKSAIGLKVQEGSPKWTNVLCSPHKSSPESWDKGIAGQGLSAQILTSTTCQWRRSIKTEPRRRQQPDRAFFNTSNSTYIGDEKPERPSLVIILDLRHECRPEGHPSRTVWNKKAQEYNLSMYIKPNGACSR